MAADKKRRRRKPGAFGMLPRGLCRMKELDSTFRVLLAETLYAHPVPLPQQPGQPRTFEPIEPTNNELAHLTGLSVATVERCRRKLDDLGIREKTKRGGRGVGSRYLLNRMWALDSPKKSLNMVTDFGGQKSLNMVADLQAQSPATSCGTLEGKSPSTCCGGQSQTTTQIGRPEPAERAAGPGAHSSANDGGNRTAKRTDWPAQWYGETLNRVAAFGVGEEGLRRGLAAFCHESGIAPQQVLLHRIDELVTDFQGKPVADNPEGAFVGLCRKWARREKRRQDICDGHPGDPRPGLRIPPREEVVHRMQARTAQPREPSPGPSPPPPRERLTLKINGIPKFVAYGPPWPAPLRLISSADPDAASPPP